MGTNIKLKDLYDEEQTYDNIGTVSVPKADGSGSEFYVKRPVINYALLDPPTHELTISSGNKEVVAWNIGAGLLFDDVENDKGNFLAVVYGPREGKTTKPFVSMTVGKYTAGLSVNSKGNALVIYLYEVVSGTVLQEIIGYEGATDFTAQIGWGQLLIDDSDNVTGYAKINDSSAVSIGVEQPNQIGSAANFYALLSEVTQDTQSVDVTENGAQTIVPTAGKSGIRKLALNVNVPSSGGNLQEKSVSITSNGTTEVTPDAGYDGLSKVNAVVNVAGGGGGVQANWAQNDSTAADYVKNRPGGFSTGLSGEVPSQTYTFDGDLTGKEVVWIEGDASEGMGYVKVSSDLPWYYQLFGGSVVTHSPQGDEASQLNTPSALQKNLEGVITCGEFAVVVHQDAEIGPGITMTAGIWFIYMNFGGEIGYTKSLTTVHIEDANTGNFGTEPLSLNAIPQLVEYDQKSLYLYSDNGTKYAITVEDTGTLKATKVIN